ncbi:hypothetical protein [Marinobacterium jannaschii]|uniref:hypothetical protein n=1 Tax=Marinobacterium jannaschii TaxID=64970 RepID=UPI0012EBF516|nr:hypothetical protein [Marinobacterium jannaschii]
MKSIWLRLMLLPFVLLLASCATVNTVANAPETEGVSSYFDEDYDLVKEAVTNSIYNLGVDIKMQRDIGSRHSIVFSKDMSAFSWGEVGRVMVIPMDDGRSKVTVYTEKRSKYQLTGTSENEFAQEIFLSTRNILAVLK